MNFGEYLAILRGQFLASFGPIDEVEAEGFFYAGWPVLQAAWMIGEGLSWDCTPRHLVVEAG